MSFANSLNINVIYICSIIYVDGIIVIIVVKMATVCYNTTSFVERELGHRVSFNTGYVLRSLDDVIGNELLNNPSEDCQNICLALL